MYVHIYVPMYIFTHIYSIQCFMLFSVINTNINMHTHIYAYYKNCEGSWLGIWMNRQCKYNIYI